METTREACARRYTSHRGRKSRENEREMSTDEAFVKIHSGDRIHTSWLVGHLWLLIFLTERNECKHFLVSVEELKLSKWNNMVI